MLNESSEDARKPALELLTAQFVAQGHPEQYATHMATAAIFQADLELRNAQLTRLLNWLQIEHNEIYNSALELLEATREEFERRVRE
jgi:hypothetical protein